MEIRKVIETSEELMDHLKNPTDMEYLKIVVSTLQWTIGQNDSPITDYV